MQRDVLILLADTGITDKAIAERLGLTEAQVKSRLRRVYDKLKIRRRAQLAIAIIEERERLDRVTWPGSWCR
jgi:DNA-binding NarL/FixJ family response regulator